MSDIKPLINKNGLPFNFSELQIIEKKLVALNHIKRKDYCMRNKAEIIRSPGQILIVSGPGTGKSQLFLDKLKYWLQQSPKANILVTSFVRKLIIDLHKKVSEDKKLTDEQKKRVNILTLHSLARSIVEINQGTKKRRFNKFISIMGTLWEQIIWEDVLFDYKQSYQQIDRETYSWEKFNHQLYESKFKKNWVDIIRKYLESCQFYNACGFAQLIISAKIALTENQKLNKFNFLIIDEYQDFNQAEDHLLKELMKKSEGVLIVGDDDQILYDTFRLGKAALIRNLYYKEMGMIKTMLPFCWRCSYHIAKVSSDFIQRNRDPSGINKIFLPIVDDNNSKVQIIACTRQSSVIKYVKKFIINHEAEIKDRQKKLLNGKEQDAFLLILTNSTKLEVIEELNKLIQPYKNDSKRKSTDYYKLLAYYLLAKRPFNNFNFRKILFYENISYEKVNSYYHEAKEKNTNYCQLSDKSIKEILDKCNNIKTILEDKHPVSKKIAEISKLIYINDENKLLLEKELEQKIMDQNQLDNFEIKIEESALEEHEIEQINAVDILSILKSKGLSADHVIILGFDNKNMYKISKNAFYVAITRAKSSLRLIVTLRIGGASRHHDFLKYMSDDNLEFYKYIMKKDQPVKFANKTDFINYLLRLKTHY